MKRIGLALASISSVAVGFLAVLWLLSSNTPQVKGPAPLFSTIVSMPQTGNADGVTVTPDDAGVVVASTFNPTGAQANTIGAVYLNIDDGKVSFPASGRLQVEIDVTMLFDEIGQAIEVQFVQNGLKQSGWQRSQLKFGRHTYSFDYDLITETRTGTKTETLWLRSDALGRNRPVVWNELRIIKKG